MNERMNDSPVTGAAAGEFWASSSTTGALGYTAVPRTWGPTVALPRPYRETLFCHANSPSTVRSPGVQPLCKSAPSPCSDIGPELRDVGALHVPQLEYRGGQGDRGARGRGRVL